MPFDGAFSPLHWLIIAVVGLLVLGPDRLPGLARRAGEMMRDLQRVRGHLRSELRNIVSEFDLDQRSDPAPLPRGEGSTADTTGDSTV